MSEWTVVSGYTPLYAEEAVGLANSLHQHEVPYRMRPFKCQGSWERNCAYKARIVRDALERRQGAVVWLDADARVLRPPTDFGYMAGDFGAFYLDGALQSGTLYFADTAAARALAGAWVSATQGAPEKWDQQVLQGVVALARDEGLVEQRLPPEYCWIDRISERRFGPLDPVIYHRQASRRLKQEVQRG